MLGWLILLFITVPLIELALLIKVGQYLGVFNTIFIVIITGFLGALLARSQGLRVLKDIQYKLDMGMLPGEHLFDGLFILVGGILLLTPGLITDLIGFLALVPYTRNLAKQRIKQKLGEMMKDGQGISFTPYRF